MLAQRMSLIVESGTSGMRNKAKKLKEAGIPVINFAAGELDIDTSDSIKEAAKKAIDNGHSKYTETMGIKPLRQLIADRVSAATGVPYGFEEIGVTAEAKQALYNAAMILFEEGDEVIIPTPYWVTYPAQVQLMGATPVFLDTMSNNYQFDIERFIQLISAKTKAVIINTPNNPSGVVYSKEILTAIAKLAIKHNFWIIFDECYNTLVHEPATHYNVVSLVEGAKEKTIIVNSFSKACSVTGWRVGYLAAPKTIINACQNLQGHTTSNVSSVAQYGAMAAFEPAHDIFLINIRSLLRERVEAALKIINTIEDVTYAPPQGAFYIFLNVKNMLGKSYEGITITNVTILAEQLLERAHVGVVPGDAFGDPHCLRISYALSKDDICEGLLRLKKFFGGLK